MGAAPPKWGVAGLAVYFLGGAGAEAGADAGADGVGADLAAYFGSYFLASAGFGADPPAGLAASGSRSKKGFPTTAVYPSATWNLVILPATGALI